MPAETVEQLTLLDKLRRKRVEDVNALATLIEARETERTAFETRDASTDDKPTDEERSAYAVAEEAFGADLDQRDAEIKTLDRRIKEQEVIEERRKAAANASGTSVSVESEPLTYRKDNAHKDSYFRDLASTVASDVGNPNEARERLSRHATEMAVEMPKREADRERRAQAELDRAERDFTGSLVGHGLREARGLEPTAFEKRVNPNTTDGQGGYAVPPLWLIDDYITALRAGRVAANLCRQITLPDGTNSINIPKLATTTLVGPQTEGGAVPSQDLTDTSIEAAVKTIAGQQDVSIQLLEQSPGQIMDQVIMGDLMADYNRLVDRDVIRGTGSTKIKGIYPYTNWSAGRVATLTASANSGQGFLQTQGAMMAKLATSRFSTENCHFLMNPRRWYWWGTTVDGASGTVGRPLVNGQAGAFNPAGLHSGGSAEGRVGTATFGPHDYYTSANVPTDDLAGVPAGGTQDPVICAKWDDLWLFEGALRTRVLTEVLSGTLQIRFQVYNYVAFLVRYGESIVLGQGAGLAPPTGSVDTAMVFGA